MASSLVTFKRLKDKGLAAYQQGDYAGARPYLIQAAECMLDIAAENGDTHVQAQQQAYARELIDLAKDCERQAQSGGHGRRQGDRARDGGEDGADPRDWIVTERPDIRFSDIAGLEDVKQEIYLKMIYPFQRPELAQHFGIDVGGGMLMYGPPGTGKTMIAKAVAAELEATMFVISPAQLMSKWVGEAEQNVRALFEAAKEEPRSVIFMDEVEALVPQRRTQESGVMQRVVPQILQELEGFDRKAGRALMFLGATNEPWTLDPAMMRPGRLDTKVYVPLPDAEARFRLFEIYLGQRPLDDDVNLAELVERTAGYSGADIKAISQRAASVPFLESMAGGEPRNIRMADVITAIEQTPPSVRARDIRRYEEWAANQLV